MDQWPFFAQTESRWHSQHQGDGFNHKSPFTQVASDNKPTQDGLDLEC